MRRVRPARNTLTMMIVPDGASLFWPIFANTFPLKTNQPMAAILFRCVITTFPLPLIDGWARGPEDRLAAYKSTKVRREKSVISSRSLSSGFRRRRKQRLERGKKEDDDDGPLLPCRWRCSSRLCPAPAPPKWCRPRWGIGGSAEAGAGRRPLPGWAAPAKSTSGASGNWSGPWPFRPGRHLKRSTSSSSKGRRNLGGGKQKQIIQINFHPSAVAKETVWALATVSREINAATSRRTDVATGRAIVATTTTTKAGCVASQKRWPVLVPLSEALTRATQKN